MEVVVEIRVGGAERMIVGEGFVEGALGGGFVAVELGQGVGDHRALLGEAGDEGGGRLGLEWFERGGRDGASAAGAAGELGMDGLHQCVVGFKFAELFLVHLFEQKDFGLGVAAEFPAEEGDALDEEVFEG